MSYYTAVISGLFSQYFDEVFRSATAQSFSCWFSHLYRISQKPLCSLYITSILYAWAAFFSMHELRVYTLHSYNCF